MKVTLLLSQLLFMLKYKGVLAPGPTCFAQPEKTWPLGEGIVNREIVTNSPPEGKGDIAFVSSTLPYKGLYFYGNASSWVDIRLTDLTNDFTLYFHINPSEHGGRILHYLSDSQSTPGITEMRLDMEADGRLTYSVNGSGIIVTNGGSDTGSFIVPVGVWSVIMMEFDLSKTNVKITNDDYATSMKENVLSTSESIVSPGIMRIASAQTGSGSSFHGAISCLHKIPGRNKCEDPAYSSECNNNWSTTTSTTTPTTTTPTTTTPTTTTSTTTTPTTTTPTTTTPTTTTPTTTTPTTTTPTTTTPTTTTPTTTTPTTTTPTTTTPTTTTPTTTTPTTTTPTTTTPTTTTQTTTTQTTTTPTTTTPTTTTPTTTTPTTTTPTTTTPTTTTPTTTTPTTTTATTTTATTTTPTTTTPTTTTPTTTTPTTTTPTTTTPTTTTPTTTTPTTTTTTPTTTTPTTTTPTTTTPTTTTATNSAQTIPTPQAILSPAMHAASAIQTGCRQYSRYHTSAVYANNADVITTKFVNNVRECILECDRVAGCMTFSVEPISGMSRCQTGSIGPVLQSSSGGSMYEVV